MLGVPKVHDLGHVVGVEDNVFELEVAVEDAVGVHVRDALAKLHV